MNQLCGRPDGLFVRYIADDPGGARCEKYYNKTLSEVASGRVFSGFCRLVRSLVAISISTLPKV